MRKNVFNLSPEQAAVVAQAAARRKRSLAAKSDTPRPGTTSTAKSRKVSPPAFLNDYAHEDKESIIEAFTHDLQIYNTKKILQMWSMSESEHEKMKEYLGFTRSAPWLRQTHGTD